MGSGSFSLLYLRLVFFFLNSILKRVGYKYSSQSPGQIALGRLESQPMRILSNDYIANLPHSVKVAHGGPANFARNFSSFAIKEGHEWLGFIQRSTEGKKAFVRKIATAPHREYTGCFFPSERMETFFKLPRKKDPRIYFSDEIACLQRFIKKIAPDLLFLNGYSLASWFMLEAATRENLPIVVQHAGIAAIEYEIYKHLYSTAARAMLLEMEQDIVRLASKQVFLNEFSYRTFSKRVLATPKKQVAIIPLPFETKNWRKEIDASMNLQEKKELVIGCVARWDRIKNHAAVLDLAREAHAQGLSWRFESVTIVPQTRLFQRFKKEYQKRVTVIPPMSRDALAAFYARMDLLILPSCFDVSPTVVMEAAGAGKPTLISPTVGWIDEYKKSGLQKWIVDFNNPTDVIKRIKQLLKQPSIRRLQNSIRELHDPRIVFNTYLHLFTDLLPYAHRSTRL